MSAELSAAKEQRIIVTTSQRGDYLVGLRALSHNAFAGSYVTILSSLQAFTAAVNFSSRPAAELDLSGRRALDDLSQQPGMLARILDNLT
jgi:hypothetical protein